MNSVLKGFFCTVALASAPAFASERSRIEQLPSPDKALVAVVSDTASESVVVVKTEAGKAMARRSFRSNNGQHGYGVVKAQWTPDSQFFVFSLESSGGHQPWHTPVEYFSRRDAHMHRLDEELNDAVADPHFVIAAPDRVTVALHFAKATSVVSLSGLSSSSEPGQDFGVEGALPNAVPLPSSAIEAIRRSPESQESLRYCYQEEQRSAKDIPASWFSAAQVNVSGSPQSGLVVRGNGCFLGAHITQFWVLAKTPTGYRSVFAARGDGISVLPTSTHGYRDLQLVFVMATGKEIQRVRLQYSKGAYQVVGRKVERQ
jgi:hypothetical protein